MTTEHTPPPWRFDPYSDNVYGSGITVARDIMVGGDGSLISAAPDLLAAWELWQSTMEMEDVDDGICTIYVPSETVDAIAAAIAKARGEAE